MSSTTLRNFESCSRPYQQAAISFAYENNAALLCLRMGAGKTVITLTAIVELLRDGHIDNVLVVAPKAVCQATWTTEPGEWSHATGLDIGIAVGTAAQRQAVLDARHTVTVINYDAIPWLRKHYPAERWGLVVLDEVTRFNNPSGKRYKAFRPVLEDATMRLGLTGSLASASLESVFNVARSIDLGATLGRTIGPFRHRYMYKADFGYKALAGSAERVGALIAPLCYRPDPTVYQSQLPPVVRSEWLYEADAKTRAIYQDVTRTYVALDGEISVGSAGDLGNKQAQALSGAFCELPGERWSTQRLDQLREIVREADGEPVLVFYWFQHTGELLREQGYAELLSNLDAWNRGEIPVAYAQPASAGHGINAQQGGRRVVWLEHCWSAESREQADARLHRQGQRDTVFVYDMVATIEGEETVDRAFLLAQEKKITVAEQVAAGINSDRGLGGPIAEGVVTRGTETN